MRGWFFVGFLVWMLVAFIAQVGVPQDAETQDAETFKQQLAHLRKCEWSESRAAGMIGALLDQKEFVAAGWWIEEAERAMASKDLPRSATKTLSGLKGRFRSEARAADPDAYKLADKLARHAEDVVKHRNFKEAGKAVACAQRFLVFFAAAGARSRLERARRKMPPPENRSDLGHKVLLKQRVKTDELVKEAQQVFESRWPEFVRAYRHYGNYASYPKMRGLVMLHGPKEQQEAVLLALREATVAWHATEELTLWVVGVSPLCVVVDGKEFGTQSEMLRQGSAGARPGWKPIKIPVLSGDMVQILGPDNEPSRMLARAVFIHARIFGRDVPKSHYYAIERNHPTSLGPAEFGELQDTPDEMKGEATWVPRRGMLFVEPSGTDQADVSFFPIVDEVFDWFKKQGVPFIGAQGSKERPALVLMVPDPPK